MSVEQVKHYLGSFGLDQQVQEFATSSATVELAAEALCVAPARIAKTLSFRMGDGCVLVVAAGDARVHSSRFKKTFGEKARMLTPEEVEFHTGHPVGGVCPFALPNSSVPVYLDESLRRFSTVFPACGSSNSAIEMTPEQLSCVAESRGWVDVCKDWQPQPDTKDQTSAPGWV